MAMLLKGAALSWDPEVKRSPYLNPGQDSGLVLYAEPWIMYSIGMKRIKWVEVVTLEG